MLLPPSLHEKYVALQREFALQSRLKVDEMSTLLQESVTTPGAEVPLRIQATLHDLKGQAGTFGYPLISEIARVAEQYVKVSPVYDDATARHLVALFEMMASLLPDEDDADYRSGSLSAAHPEPVELY